LPLYDGKKALINIEFRQLTARLLGCQIATAFLERDAALGTQIVLHSIIFLIGS
jgi:hypothetical protein